MEFDENLNPIVQPTPPSPWNQPPPYQPPTPPVTPPTTLPPPQPQPPLTPLLVTPSINTPVAQIKPSPTFSGALVMMFIITLISLAFLFADRWFGTNTSPREITVSGTGIAYSAPDVAKIDFGVRTEARNLADSQRANAEAISKIKNDLGAFEIKPEDIQTINYTINPDYTYLYSQKPRLIGYTTYHFLRLTIRKLDSVDSILQTLGHSGATDISQIKFTIDDPAEIKSEAREKAIANAKELANQLVNLSDAKLGQIISIQEESSTENESSRFIDGMGGGGASPGIEEGSLSATSKVTLTYSLR